MPSLDELDDVPAEVRLASLLDVDTPAPLQRSAVHRKGLSQRRDSKAGMLVRVARNRDTESQKRNGGHRVRGLWTQYLASCLRARLHLGMAVLIGSRHAGPQCRTCGVYPRGLQHTFAGRLPVLEIGSKCPCDGDDVIAQPRRAELSFEHRAVGHDALKIIRVRRTVVVERYQIR